MKTLDFIHTPEGRARSHLSSLVGDLEHTDFDFIPTDNAGQGFVQTIVSLEGGERFRVEVEFIDEDAR